MKTKYKFTIITSFILWFIFLLSMLGCVWFETILVIQIMASIGILLVVILTFGASMYILDQ